MNNLKSIFLDKYNNTKKIITEEVRKKFIYYWQEGYDFGTTKKRTIEHLVSTKPELEIYSSTYKENLEFFDQYYNRMFPENPLKILAFEIAPNYQNIENNKISINEFTMQLAIREAYKEVIELFETHNNFFAKIYKLKKLDGYKSMKVFEIKKYNKHILNTDIYKELEELEKELEELDIDFDKLNRPNLKQKKYDLDNSILLPKYNLDNRSYILEHNFFELSDPYILKFGSKAFYKFLTNDVIDADKTSYLDFIKVFFINPEYHRSHIFFKCSTQLAALFSEKLIKEYFSKLTKTAIGNNYLFKSKKENNISQTSLTNSTKKISKDNNLINHTILEIFEYLEGIPTKTI